VSNSIKKILKSSYTDVHTNLAIEDWIFKNSDEEEEILLMWKNDPCVVIGRHQNPWVECNLPFLHQNGVQLARRNSGGGTVYHDQGNLNLSFLTKKQTYNRRRNLELICSSLNRLGLEPIINERDDILLDGKKISGTAAKITRNKAYHHCTILVNVDRDKLSRSLKNPHVALIQTNATKSVRSPVDNIGRSSGVSVHEVEQAVAHVFSPGADIEQVDDLILKGSELRKIRDELSSWSWIFGKSPQFTVAETLKINQSSYHVSIRVVKGHIESAKVNNETLSVPDPPLPFSVEALYSLANTLSEEKREVFVQFAELMRKIAQ